MEMGVWSSGTMYSPGAPHLISGLCFAIASFSQLYCCLRKDLSSRMAEATGAGLEGGRSGTVRQDCAQGYTQAQEGEGGEKH